MGDGELVGVDVFFLYKTLATRLSAVVDYMRGISNSLQIFRARLLSISVCLGTEARRFRSGFHHRECLLPSLRNSHPCFSRCLVNCLSFIHQYLLPQTHLLFDAMLPGHRIPKYRKLLLLQIHFPFDETLQAFHLLRFREA